MVTLPHLTESQISDYRARALSVPELLMVQRHLGECSACREKISASLGLKSSPAEIHHDFGFADAEKSDVAAECKPLFEILRSKFRRPTWRTLTLGALMLALWGALVWRVSTVEKYGRSDEVGSFSKSARPEAGAGPAVEDSTRPPNPALALTKTLRDGDETIGLTSAGELSGAAPAPKSVRTAMINALITQRIPRSNEVQRLQAGRLSALRGEGSDPNSHFRLRSPVGVVVASRRPTFRWEPVEGAARYVVTVVRDSDRTVELVSDLLTKTQWTAPVALKFGTVYVWQAEATLTDGRKVLAPSAPEPEAKFQIIRADAMKEIRRLAQMRPSSHLALGVAYARAGLLSEARQELRILAHQNPDSELVRLLARSLD
jgi:hypothetical protein